jgi:hypothetical protein
MTRHYLTRSILLLVIAALTHSAMGQDFAGQRLSNWHQWRGPEANGVSPNGNPPTEWSEGKNIKWKVPIPGKGSASPIIWGDRIFVLTAIPAVQAAPNDQSAWLSTQPQVMGQPQRNQMPGEQGRRGQPRGGRQGGGRGGEAAPGVPHKFEVICIDRRTGQTIWQKTARETIPHEGHHPTSTFASASPITDGSRLFVSFGSRGIYAFDLNGNQLWDKDLGDMRTRNGFGEGASPALHGNTLVVPWDHEDDSFIVAFDATNGREKWRQPREEITTWGTPLMVPYAGRVQVVTNGMNRVRSYDLETGEVLWECGGQGPNPIPSPVVMDNLAIAMTGFRSFAAYAIPLDSRGDITNTDKPAWKLTDGTPYVASPLLYDGILYFTKDRNNLLTTVNARTGEVLIDKVRLPNVNTVYSSPVGAAGRVYISSREGSTVVLKHGPEKEMTVLAENQLDGPIDASPAIIGNELYLRTDSHLYCIAEAR